MRYTIYDDRICLYFGSSANEPQFTVTYPIGVGIDGNKYVVFKEPLGLECLLEDFNMPDIRLYCYNGFENALLLTDFIDELES